MRLFFCFLTLSGLALSSLASAAEMEPIRYQVRFPAPQTHYAEVEAHIPTDAQEAITLMMPVWTPGSYYVREYARNVEALTAENPDAQPLAVERISKNRWKITTAGAPSVTVRYRIYAREMSVQGNFIDASFALLNGAPSFITRADALDRPHEVTLHLPDAWATSVTGLPAAPDAAPHHYVAADYDTLVDSPIYAGNPAIYTFEVDGKTHVLVNEGEAGVWDGPRSARDVEAIVRAQRDFWGQLPYDRYVFFNILSETGGGLEHRNSTVLMASRWATRTRPRYLGWLNLVSHEFFHTWNVKRLRPVELGPFDYEREVNSKSLWIAEGITSYYDRLLVRRAGLCTDAEVIAGDPSSGSGDSSRGTNDIERLQDTPGRLVQTLEDASFDAWIKLYRRDENTGNTSISYYVKGAVVALLLDARIRTATDGAKSLDDVMRLAYERYSGESGFTPEQFRATASEVAGVDLSDWFRQRLETTEELDYTEVLEVFGLRFVAPPKKDDDDKPEKAWLGLSTRNEDGRLVVSQVPRQTPGFDAGFNVGDEILALADFRIRPDGLSRLLQNYKPGDTLSILIARRDQLRRLDVTLGAEPPKTFRLEENPDATDAQKRERQAWLTGAKNP